MPLNKELLLKAKAHILAEPARLRMGNWIITGRPGQSVGINILGNSFGESDHFVMPSCGKVGCIAGWIVLLGDPDYLKTIDPYQSEEEARTYGLAIAVHAAELLGVDSDEVELLFHFPFQDSRYKYATTQEERAQLVAENIDNFIEEYKER